MDLFSRPAERPTGPAGPVLGLVLLGMALGGALWWWLS